MNLLTRMVVVNLLLLSAASAQADQCAYVSKDYAQKAMNLLNDRIGSEDQIVRWCEPCGELKPPKQTAGDVIKSVTITHTGYQDFYEIHINGLSVDMAYTYIAGINLASYINANAGLRSETAGQACDLQGVSEEL